MSGQWDERSWLADFQKKFFAPEKRQRKKCFFLSFYTLSYLDVLGYCVSLLNIVIIKAPLLEQKDRIWVVDGILGQQSFNIVTCNNKFSNYLRQFELSFFQSNSQPHQWTTFIPKLLYHLVCTSFSTAIGWTSIFPPDSKPLGEPRGHSALCLFRTRAWYRGGMQGMWTNDCSQVNLFRRFSSFCQYYYILLYSSIYYKNIY